MFTISNYDYECTRKCRNQEHGKIINCALTKRSIDNEKLAAFIAKQCRNFSEVLDYEGRSALHIAASIGKYMIAEWLINHGANINLRDDENGHTPLHRAIYYGNIDVAVLLIRYGASFDILDGDFLYPLQHRANHTDDSRSKRIREFLVWGNNKNYNLGIGNEQGNYWPQSIEEFRKNGVHVEYASIATYHSLFLTTSHEIYAVGHGKGGRLGTGAEHTLVEPKRIKLPSKSGRISKVSSGRYHSLFITDDNAIYSTGLNNYNQLGVKPPSEKLLQFTPITGQSEVSVKFRGIKAHDTYSLAYNESAIYVWGTNNGQFGLGQEIKSILTIQELGTIKTDSSMVFDSCDAAIVYATPNKFIHVLHKFKCKSFKSPGLESVIKIRMVGFDSVEKEVNAQDSAVKILVLTGSGVHIWYEDIQKYVRCLFNMARSIRINNIKKCGNRFLIISDGDLYIGTPKRVNAQSIEMSGYKETFSTNIDGSSKIRVDMKKLPNVSRVLWYTADSNGENFAVLQTSSRYRWEDHAGAIKIRDNEDFNEFSFEKLYNETDEFDAVHDIVFQVGDRNFAAHKFIVCNRAPKLSKLIKSSKDKHFHLTRDHLTADVFEVILRFLYTNISIGMDNITKLYEGVLEKREALKTFHSILDSFGISDYVMNTHTVKTPYPSFDRESHKDLYDIIITCENEQEIRAHKCILVARLDYFAMMFGHTWSESNNVNLSTIPHKYMQPLVEFLYTNNFSKFSKDYHSDTFVFTLITICDQFFAEHMKHYLQQLIFDRLMIKNCSETLEFACAFNCQNLEKLCLEFICYNIERVLENHSLDHLEADILAKISCTYKNVFKDVDYRMLTPFYCESVDDDSIESFIYDFKVDLEYKMTIDETSKKVKKTKVKANRTLLERRQLERNAIHLMKDLSIDEYVKHAPQTSSNEITIEAQLISDKFKTASKSWMSVKTDNKKKVLGAVKTNEIMKNEEKPQKQFTNLNDVLKSSPTAQKIAESPKTPKTSMITTPETTPEATRSIINLGDFTPLKNGKLSQKQRKKLSMELASPQSSHSVSMEKTTEAMPETPRDSTPNSYSTESVWGNVSYNNNSNQSTPLLDILKTTRSRKSSSNVPDSTTSATSPIDIPSRRQHNNSTSSIKSPNSFTGNSYSSPNSFDFFAIQKTEKQQRENYEKMKTKSLVLTQIEERAIEELKRFYNVENVFDEHITIDRRSKITANVSIWGHQ